MLLELMVRLSVPSTICTQTEGMGAGTFCLLYTSRCV